MVYAVARVVARVCLRGEAETSWQKNNTGNSSNKRTKGVKLLQASQQQPSAATKTEANDRTEQGSVGGEGEERGGKEDKQKKKKKKKKGRRKEGRKEGSGGERPQIKPKATSNSFAFAFVCVCAVLLRQTKVYFHPKRKGKKQKEQKKKKEGR